MEVQYRYSDGERPRIGQSHGWLYFGMNISDNEIKAKKPIITALGNPEDYTFEDYEIIGRLEAGQPIGEAYVEFSMNPSREESLQQHREKIPNLIRHRVYLMSRQWGD